jgi:hypothetical protein
VSKPTRPEVPVFKRAAVAAVMLVSAMSFAQTEPRRPQQGRYQKVTEVGFDGELIEADPTRPDIEYFDAPDRVQHSSLVRIREDFRDEALDSAPGL